MDFDKAPLKFSLNFMQIALIVYRIHAVSSRSLSATFGEYVALANFLSHREVKSSMSLQILHLGVKCTC